MPTTLRLFASLWLTVGILVVMVVLLVAANLLAGYDITVGSLRRDWYGSIWFTALLGLLMVNLTACTVKRKPWQFWQWGFLVTHAGILTLMIGSGVSFLFKIYGDMQVGEGQSASTFEIEGERELIVRTQEGEIVREERVPLRVNPYVRSQTSVHRAIRGTNVVLYVDEYVPSVSRTPAYETAPGGRGDVLELRFHPPLGGSSIFVPARQPMGNRMLSLMYVPGEPEFFRNLAEADGEQGTLDVTIDGETRAIDVKACLGQPVRVGKREVVVRRFYSTFDVGSGSEPQDAGRDQQPAVMFDVVADGKTDTYYAFSLMPDVSPTRRGGGHGAEADFRAQLRYAPKQSGVWFFALDDGLRWVVTSKQGKVASGPLRPREKVKHPFAPMELHFELLRRIPNAVETVREEPPRKGMPTVPAVKVRLSRYPEQSSAWLRLYEQSRVSFEGLNALVEFAPTTYQDLGFAVELVKFKNPPQPGDPRRAAKFESDLRIHDHGTREMIDGTTGVNVPFSHRGWVFYQSAFNDQVTPVVSILQVSFDPGKRILYLGFIMAASGTIFMFFLKQYLVRLIKPAQSAADAPMGPIEPLVWLSLVSAGTIGSMVALFVKPGLSPLLIGSLMALANVVAGFALAATALSRSPRRPGWALQLGKIVAAGWCINTAALVLFMILRVT